MIRLSVFAVPALAIGTLLFAAAPQPGLAMTNSTFYGITVHVSSQNIKVQDPKTKEVLSFVIVPKFDQVFSADGKTTYQMSHVRAGQYVGIIYDQKALGVRHADKIYIMDNANQRIGTQ